MACTCYKRGSVCPIHNGPRCTKRVWPAFPTAYPSTCARRAIKDGLCAYHQPEAIKAREAKRDAKREALHARFRHNSDVHAARQRVVEEAVRASEPGHESGLSALWRACRRLAKLQKKGPTT